MQTSLESLETLNSQKTPKPSKSLAQSRQTAANRHIKIFISSTFRDMHIEREILRKEIFPKLRHHVKDRFVEITEMDLRWGVSKEQSDNGDTLKVCLDAIDDCKSNENVFFIGLIGNRYGWNEWYESFNKKLLDDPHYEWLKDENLRDKSATELEIIHSIFSHP